MSKITIINDTDHSDALVVHKVANVMSGWWPETFNLTLNGKNYGKAIVKHKKNSNIYRVEKVQV